MDCSGLTAIIVPDWFIWTLAASFIVQAALSGLSIYVRRRLARERINRDIFK